MKTELKTEAIKSWLKSIKKDRAWLAGQCGVSKSTVDGWMAGRVIPNPAQHIIAALMYADKPVSPRFSMEQFAKIQQKAKQEGLTLQEWVEKTVIKSLILSIGLFLSFHLWRSPSKWSVAALSNSASVIITSMR